MRNDPGKHDTLKIDDIIYKQLLKDQKNLSERQPGKMREKKPYRNDEHKVTLDLQQGEKGSVVMYCDN